MPALLLLLEEEQAFTPFSINTGMVFWTLLVFLILLGLLAKLGWPALLKSVEDRERRIQRQLDEAEKARAEAVALLEQHKALLAAARHEAQEIVAKARAAAEAQGEVLLGQARKEGEGLLVRVRKEVTAEKVKAVQALRREAVDLSIAVASKLLEARLDSDANRKLVSQYLETLARSQ